MEIKLIKSRREQCVEELKRSIIAAMEVIGSKAAGYALLLAPHDTGRLRNSVTWATTESEGRAYSYEDDNGKRYDDEVRTGVPKNGVAVGTNVEYAA